MKTVSIRFPDAEFYQLDNLSHSLNRSVNDLIRESVKVTLESHGFSTEEEKDISEFKVIQLPRVEGEFKPFQTKYELILLEALRAKGLTCQHNLKLFGFYPDIFLPEYNLVVEVDGAIHHSKKRKNYDHRRTKIFNEKGIEVMRFTNKQVERNLSHCVRVIYAYVRQRSQTPNLLAFKKTVRK